MEESSAIHLWHDKFERWKMRDRKHGKLEKKNTNFTQMLKGNIKALPVNLLFLHVERWETKRAWGLWMKGPFNVKAFKDLGGERAAVWKGKKW